MIAEELDIAAVLAELEPHNLSPIERVLAAHTGPVQLLLSLHFGTPVDVKLVEQREEHGELRRQAVLVLRRTGQEACFARSVIPIGANGPEVLADVRAGTLGLGQIAVRHRIPTERRVLEIAVTPAQVRRSYVMRGPGLHYRITEIFPRDLYRVGFGPMPPRPERAAAVGGAR